MRAAADPFNVSPGTLYAVQSAIQIYMNEIRARWPVRGPWEPEDQLVGAEDVAAAMSLPVEFVKESVPRLRIGRGGKWARYRLANVREFLENNLDFVITRRADMIYLIPAFLLGMLACWLIWRPERKRLIFNNEMLLDFNEKMLREKEELEEQAPHLWRQMVTEISEEVSAFDCLRPRYLRIKKDTNKVTVSNDHDLREVVFEFNPEYPLISYVVNRLTPQRRVEELRGNLGFRVNAQHGDSRIFRRPVLIAGM